MTKTIRVLSPAPGTGYRVLRGRDGRLTSVPLRNDERALYGLPTMAMDAAPRGKDAGGYFDPNRPQRALSPVDMANRRAGPSGTYDADDPSDPDNDYDADGSGDLEDKIRQLLEGKLDDADVEMLIRLIQPDPEADRMPATDRRLPRVRQAHDGWRPSPALDALIRQRVAESGPRRAAKAAAQIKKLTDRFPALKGARVV